MDGADVCVSAGNDKLLSVPLIADYIEYLRLELSRSPHTLEAYRRDLTQLADFIAPVALQEAGATDVRRWIASLGRDGEAPRTLRRKTQAARSLFRWMQKRGLRPDNPAADIILAKPAKPLPTFVREEEMESLLEPDGGIEERDRVILELLYGCGLRRSELLQLTDADVDTSGRRLTVLGKGRKTRIVPLAPQLCSLIEVWRRERDARYERLDSPAPIIPGRDGGPMSASGLYKIVRSLLSATTTARRSPHTLRHSFATAMVNGGAGIDSVRDLLGHSSIATTQIYTHLDFRRLRSDYTAAHPRENPTHRAGDEPEK